MTKQNKIDTNTAKPVAGNNIEDHLLEQVVGGGRRGYSLAQRNELNAAAAEAVAEVPETPPQDVSTAGTTVETVMAGLPTEEPTYTNPAETVEEQKPEFDLSTSYTAEAENIKTEYSTGIEGVLRADSSGAAIGFGLSAKVMTEINLGEGATLTNTTETSISSGAQIMYDNGIGAELSAEISTTVAWEVARQTDLGNGVTMDNSAGVEGFMGANAEGDAYVGEEGAKAGFDLKAGADYTAETSGEIDASQIAMTGEASVSSSGSIGAAFSQEATYKDGALTLGMSGDVDAVLAGAGLGGSVSIQFEDKYGTVGSAAEIAAVQAQLEHFDSAADLDRSLTETWHNDLKNDAESMREQADWAEQRLDRHVANLQAFDEAVSFAVDNIAEREASLPITAARLASDEAEIRAEFPDSAAYDQAIADVRALESGLINHFVDQNGFRDLGNVYERIEIASATSLRDVPSEVMENAEPPERLAGPTSEAWARLEVLRQESPEVYSEMRAFVVDDATQGAQEERLGLDKELLHAAIQADDVQDFIAEEKALVDGFALHLQMSATLADGLETKFETVKDISYSAAVVTADKMVAIADANVEDAAKSLSAAQEKLAAAQLDVDNSPRVYVGKGSYVNVSAEDAAALEDAKTVVEAATTNMAQAMVDQRELYSQASTLHPDQSLAATENLAHNLHQNAIAAMEKFESQFHGTEMTRVERAEFCAYENMEHLFKVFEGDTKDDGKLLDNKAAEFSEKSEVLKAQLSLLTAMELQERGVLGYAEEYYNEATDVLGDGVTEMARAGEVSIDAIGSAATTAGNAVADAATTAGNAVADGVTTAAGAVVDFGDSAVNEVSSWFSW